MDSSTRQFKGAVPERSAAKLDVSESQANRQHSQRICNIIADNCFCCLNAQPGFFYVAEGMKPLIWISSEAD